MRQRSILRLAVTALFALLLADRAVAQPGRVGGLVKDDKGEPIRGATITAENTNIGSTFTATTDDKGRFVIIGLRAGTWRFIAQAPGFAPEAGEMPVRTGAANPPLAFNLRRSGPGWVGAMAGIAAKDLQADLAAAEGLYNQQKWDEAIAAYRSILNKTPALVAINLQIAAAYRNKKDFDGAMTAYNALLTADPENQKAKIGIGLTTLERGDARGAEEALTKAAELPSAGREIFFTLGEFTSDRNQPDDATRWFEKASNADPSWGKPLYKLAGLALTRGDKPAATKLLDRVVTVDPSSTEAELARKQLAELNR